MAFSRSGRFIVTIPTPGSTSLKVNVVNIFESIVVNEDLLILISLSGPSGFPRCREAA